MQLVTEPLLELSLSLSKLVSVFHCLGDDTSSLVAAEPHAVSLLALLEGDDELVVGLRGLENILRSKERKYLRLYCLATGSRQDADEVLVVPLVGGLHGAGVVGGDGGRTHTEHSLVLSLPRVLRDHEGTHLQRESD